MYNLGDKFFINIIEWLDFYPEIKHIWRGKCKSLDISSPNNEGWVSMLFHKRTVEIISKGIKTKFKQRCFVSINQQIRDIRIYLYRELYQGKKIQIPKIKLCKGQFAIECCDPSSGKILTVDKNPFIGWGEVYTILNNIKDVEKYLSQNNNYEIYVYNHNYELIRSTDYNRLQ